MKLLIVHLSDMHFGNDTNFTMQNVNSIVNAMNTSISEVQTIIVLVSGDLSYSGTKLQLNDVKRFFSFIKSSIYKRYSIKKVYFYVVPGNHDVDYNLGVGDIKRSGLEKIEADNSYELEIKNELEKLDAFYHFAKNYHCFQNKNILNKRVITVGEKKIQLNLINSAVFSSLDEDQGYHFISQVDVDRLKEQTDCDFVFTVMHHPCSWYNYRVTDVLEDVLYQNSDIIFVGHKHYETTKKITDYQYSVDILAGGMLSNKGNWLLSEFHTCLLDVESRNVITKRYQWEKAEDIYVEIDFKSFVLSKDRINPLGFYVRSKYLNERINQDGLRISESFITYFVFPLLEEVKEEQKGSSGHRVDDIETFISKLSTYKRIVIYGLKDSGKTTLLKAVFCELLSKKILVYVNGNDISSDFEASIRNAFIDIYGSESFRYEAFKQANINDIVVMIDDFDAVNENIRDDFEDFLINHFGNVIETCQQDIDLSIESRLKKSRNRKDSLVYMIEPFYSDKRRELVSKVVNIIGNDGQNKDNIIDILCTSLSSQKTLYNWNPIFIIQFTKYFYNNIGESSQKDGDVFSKVFEYNLTSLIKPFAKKNITVDKILMILDKIAYYIFKNKQYPISDTKICLIIEDYNDKYDETVKPLEFINTLVDARIIKPVDKGYLFYERSYLAYFTAREIRRCINSGDFDDIKHVMEYSYMNINADILLFVTYITDNLNIIRLLMDLADEVSSKWQEFSISSVNIPYMLEPANIKIEPVKEGDREKEEKRRIEIEKEQSKLISMSNDSSIFDGESEKLNFIQEVVRGTALMITLARALPSFEHMMEKADKERCVNLLYKMPLRLFYVWANEVNAVRSELVQMIKDFHEWEYRKDKINYKPLSDQEALVMLRWESTSLLLELMNASISYSTKENTSRYINQFNYGSDISYGIEHLICTQRRDLVNNFVSESIELYDGNNTELARLMILRVAKKFMVTSKRIQYQDIQKLNSKLFANKLKSVQLLLEQNRNKKKQ